jgi:glycosyltransferase involved in cell wall biosynthesis
MFERNVHTAPKNLWIQIPTYNEELTIAGVLSQISDSYIGCKNTNILIIDDGSTDSTLNVVENIAKEKSNIHILRISPNRGLANAFSEGIKFCLAFGAEIIINTDGDGQYNGEDIPRLLEPILNAAADVAIGDRIINSISEFSFLKKFLQKFGSGLTSLLCGFKINDATSGFRAYNRQAALSIFISSKFTYTLESIVQLSSLNMKTVNVPIRRNPSLRPSRLFKSNLQYVRKNGFVLIRSYFRYKPAKTFLFISALSAFSALIIWIPSIENHFSSMKSDHLQSTILGAVLMMNSFIMFGMALVGDAILQNKLLIHSLHSKLSSRQPLS